MIQIFTASDGSILHSITKFLGVACRIEWKSTRYSYNRCCLWSIARCWIPWVTWQSNNEWKISYIKVKYFYFMNILPHIMCLISIYIRYFGVGPPVTKRTKFHDSKSAGIWEYSMSYTLHIRIQSYFINVNPPCILQLVLYTPMVLHVTL